MHPNTENQRKRRIRRIISPRLPKGRKDESVEETKRIVQPRPKGVLLGTTGECRHCSIGSLERYIYGRELGYRKCGIEPANQAFVIGNFGKLTGNGQTGTKDLH